VYIRKKIRRKRTFLQKYKTAALLLFGAAFCLSSFIAIRKLRESSELLQMHRRASEASTGDIRQFKPQKGQRYVYPYSVIPGGVTSREELLDSIGSDDVVAKHYAGFKAAEMQLTRSQETQFMYASYRLQHKIYWTKNRLKINKGETLITDGRTIARGRCGNILSATPMKPVLDAEPQAETFDIPALALLDLPEPEPVLQKGLNTNEESGLFVPKLARLPQKHMYRGDRQALPIPSDIIIPFHYKPIFTVLVPEPGTFGMLAIGLAFLSMAALRKK
jgi:hypothetical protein